MALVQYFTNLKADMEEKQKNLLKTDGSTGWGAAREDGAREDGGGGGGGGGPREDGAREDGGGGGGPRRDPFVYFTKAVPSNSFTAFEHGVHF